MERHVSNTSSFDDVSKNLLTCTFRQVSQIPSIFGKLQDCPTTGVILFQLCQKKKLKNLLCVYFQLTGVPPCKPMPDDLTSLVKEERWKVPLIPCITFVWIGTQRGLHAWALCNTCVMTKCPFSAQYQALMLSMFFACQNIERVTQRVCVFSVKEGIWKNLLWHHQLCSCVMSACNFIDILNPLTAWN